MALVFQDQSGLAPGISQLATALGQGFQNQAKIQREQQQNSLIQQILSANQPVSSSNSILSDAMGPQRSPTQISDEQINAAFMINPNLAKLLQERKSGESKEKITSFKETSKYREGLAERFQGAQENKWRLNRMEDLIERGELSNPLMFAALEHMNLGDATSLLNPDSQEFKKLSLDLTAGMTKDFKGRINIQEFKTFLQRVPSLMQSDEGKKRVIENFKRISVDPTILRYNASKEIIKENNGIPPLDLAERIEERISPELDKISESLNISMKEATNNKQLTSDIAKQILMQAKGDKNKARKIAKKKGYIF